MSDRYQALTNSPLGALTGRIGLPAPPLLVRHEPGRPAVTGTVVLDGARGGRLGEPAAQVLRSIGAGATAGGGETADAAALVFDASGIDEPERLRALYEFFHPLVRGLRRNGRIVVLAGVPEEESGPAAIAQRASEGFTRSIAKEIGGKGSTAQLVRVARWAEDAIESTLRFLLSAR